jgi:hypothetical protein
MIGEHWRQRLGSILSVLLKANSRSAGFHRGRFRTTLASLTGGFWMPKMKPLGRGHPCFHFRGAENSVRAKQAAEKLDCCPLSCSPVGLGRR